MALLSSVSRSSWSPARSRMFTASSGVRFRFGPRRRGEPEAQVIPLGGGLLNAPSVAEVVDHLQTHGFDTILTSALTPDEQRPFLDVGFRTEHDLHLLLADLRPLAETNDRQFITRGTRRMRRRDLSRVLDIDAAAFSPFWQLDRIAFAEARTATPSCRLRVVSAGGPTRRNVVGYAVTGRSGDHGFVQRLAVDPDHQGRGVGRTLLDDALHWLVHHRARTVLVNTQPDNDPALGLYRSAGFADSLGGLSVLRLGPRSS